MKTFKILLLEKFYYYDKLKKKFTIVKYRRSRR
ncbi:hypothetical protein HMPREF9709_00290 [Helcococcus kunzii ATCC 51366]|uniref:Uncharacterized protein n=1 Tax=Helcococcus kunzii ATCC 51366 TaxID=883114 RepID=H3NLS9_9FIRM|nr:hypothetical protein HMPREF9709_00290 [Helcococcus kunzii ATCC 51366]